MADKIDVEQLIAEINASTSNGKPRVEDLIADMMTGAPSQQMEMSPEDELAQLKQQHPFLYWPARLLAESPLASKHVQAAGRAVRPAVEFAEDTLHLPEFGAGVLQTMADLPISAANVGAHMLGTDTRFQHPDFRSMLNKEESVGGDIASVLGNILGGYGGYKKGVDVAQSLPKIPGYGGLLDSVIKGTAVGGILGETGEGGEGRGLGAAIGAAFAPLDALTKSALGSRVAKDTAKLKSHFNNLYDAIFEKAANQGARGVRPPPNLDYEGLSDFLKSDYRKTLYKYLQNPTLKNSQDLQSDLGKFINDISVARKSGKVLGAGKNDAEQIAADLQKRLRGGIFTELNKASPDLGNEYLKTTFEYGEKLAPRLTGGMQKHLSGDIKSGKLFDTLLKNERFMKDIASEYPMLGTRQGLEEALKNPLFKDMLLPIGKGAAGVGLAGYGLSHFLGNNSGHGE